MSLRSFSFRSLRPLVFGVLALTATLAATAAPKLKLGTLAPVGTSYHKALQAMAEAWKKESAGTVNFTIFAGGKLGGEAEMVGLMKLGSLHAAMLSGVGLTEIEPAVTGLQNLPMGFRTLEEVDYVGERLRPLLEERMAKKGFVVVFWTDAGWVRFFANQPAVHPDDFRKLKLFTWAGDAAQVEIYQSAGFDAVPLETADIVPNLQTKLIDAVPMPPFFAMAAQIDTRAPHMLDLNWAPLVGALVVRKETWDALPEAVRTKLRDSAQQTGRDVRAAARREMTESVAAMEKRGLKVAKVSPEVEAEWRKIAESVYPMIRGKVIPADIYDETLRLLAEYRAGKR